MIKCTLCNSPVNKQTEKVTIPTKDSIKVEEHTVYTCTNCNEKFIQSDQTEHDIKLKFDNEQ